VQFSNWDGTEKGDKYLRDWDLDRGTIMNWAEEL